MHGMVIMSNTGSRHMEMWLNWTEIYLCGLWLNAEGISLVCQKNTKNDQEINMIETWQT